ncbi:unnamed protein product, partial [Ectocarpus sp. 12 AP-2014]
PVPFSTATSPKSTKAVPTVGRSTPLSQREERAERLIALEETATPFELRDAKANLFERFSTPAILPTSACRVSLAKKREVPSHLPQLGNAPLLRSKLQQNSGVERYTKNHRHNHGTCENNTPPQRLA